MIKILHVTFDMRIGGTEQVIKNIIQGSDHNQFEMGIICLESPLGPYAKELQDENIKFFQLNRQSGFDLSLIKSVRKIIKQNNIDILHCHQYTPWVYGALAAAFTNTKVIFTEHGRFYPDSSSIKRQLINPILNTLTYKITAISKATKQALVNYEFLPKRKIDVIYNGIKPLQVEFADIELLRQQLSIKKGTFILGTVARLDPIKNHKMMIEAFNLVLKTHPNTKLIIVGDGEQRQNIEYLIQTLNLEQKVILTGYIEQPKNYIALFDTFLLSSFSEGTSMTLLEAMSLSKPCVVTNAGGNKEIVKNMINGIVSKNNHLNDYHQAICKVINDSKLILYMNENSLNLFTTNFVESLMNKQYSSLYSRAYL